VRVLAMGDAAILLEPDDARAALGLAVALRRGAPPGIEDVVPAERSVLVRFAAPLSAAEVARWARSVAARPAEPVGGGRVELDVAYDGADLAEVGRLTGLGAPGVVEAHTGQEWVVAFSGFAPGFGYLRPSPSSDDRGAGARLAAVPRRDEPRARVPAGAVAVAAGYSGVYPRASPGGWQLIGRTDAALWDAERNPPALLPPGVRVRFRVAR
jgi:KipI family sensor histidine kinase inhibitor